jgi:hypothetical protein
MKTVITIMRGNGSKPDRVEIPHEDATTQAIAQATIDLIQSSMSLSEGDTIYIMVKP